MTHFLLGAILVALLVGLPALRRGLGIVALIVLLWAASFDNTNRGSYSKRSPASDLPATSNTTVSPLLAPIHIPPPPAPPPTMGYEPPKPEPKRKIIQQ
jgi:hypothetical protein